MRRRTKMRSSLMMRKQKMLGEIEDEKDWALVAMSSQMLNVVDNSEVKILTNIEKRLPMLEQIFVCSESNIKANICLFQVNLGTRWPDISCAVKYKKRDQIHIVFHNDWIQNRCLKPVQCNHFYLTRVNFSSRPLIHVWIETILDRCFLLLRFLTITTKHCIWLEVYSNIQSLLQRRDKVVLW